MKTQPTIRRSLIIGLAIVMLTTVLGIPGSGAQTAATVTASSCAQAENISALVLVDNPADVEAVAPIVREEVAALVLADLVRLGIDGRSVEVAIGRMGRQFSLTAGWTDLDPSTHATTVEALRTVPRNAARSLAASIEGAQQELVDRVEDGGCGIVVAMPIGPVGFTADEAGGLCASGGTIDSLRSLPAHLGVIATPTAIAAVDRSLLDTIAGASGSEQSCGSVSAEGAVIIGANRSELLAPAGRLVDSLTGAARAADETDVCLVFACPEGSTTIDAPAGTDTLAFEGVFSAFGYDVVLESPSGDRVTLPSGASSTVELDGASVTALWPSGATVSLIVAGEALEGSWTATVVDTSAGAASTAKWQHSVIVDVTPAIAAISPTEAGADTIVEVELFAASGERVDAAALPSIVPDGALVDTVTGTRTPIEFTEIVDGAHIGTVRLPDDLGPEADIEVAVNGGPAVIETFTVTDVTPAVTPTGDSGDSDGGLPVRTLVFVGLAVIAGILVVWLLRRRTTDGEAPDVRRGSFEVVIGPDGHISRVIDDRTHPLFFRGPDFTSLGEADPGGVDLDGLEISRRRSWWPFAPARNRARSGTGPVIGSDGRVEADGALLGVLPADLARSWAFVLDVEATAHANQVETATDGVVRGRLDVFIDDSLSASNSWLTDLVEALPGAGRDAYRWANDNGLTDVRLGGPPITGTYAEFASMVTD